MLASVNAIRHSAPSQIETVLRNMLVHAELHQWDVPNGPVEQTMLAYAAAQGVAMGLFARGSYNDLAELCDDPLVIFRERGDDKASSVTSPLRRLALQTLVA